VAERKIDMFFTLWTVRLSLCFFALFALRKLTRRRVSQENPRGKNSGPDGLASWLWALATVFFTAHVIAAFAEVHDWSHVAALSHTADVTAEHTGVRMGGGLYLNYLFTLVCVAEAIWMFCWPASHKLRPGQIGIAIGCFTIFMIVNGAIIFANGPVRWFSLVVSIVLVLLYVRKVPYAKKVPSQSSSSN